MKLYYSPGACSLAVHIVLSEGGFKYELEKTDLSKKVTASGADYNKINPKGYVPALEMENGQILTEGTAINFYLADQKPESNLAPKSGTTERYRAMEWMLYIATELHKSIGGLFDKSLPAEVKDKKLSLIDRRLAYLASQLGDKPFLIGDNFSIGDAYLFTILNWCAPLKVDLNKWPNVVQYLRNIYDRPAVQKALSEEGLV